MKAIEILEEVIRQGYLPDCGTMNYDGTVTLRDWYGWLVEQGFTYRNAVCHLNGQITGINVYL